jgi:hypothetical protein
MLSFFPNDAAPMLPAVTWLPPGLPGRHARPQMRQMPARSAGQAAFARRIRRRRSEERSSSLSPPQVPYFSGRPMA